MIHLVSLYSFKTVSLGENVTTGDSCHSQIRLSAAVCKVHCATICVFIETQTPNERQLCEQSEPVDGVVNLLAFPCNNSGNEAEEVSQGK